MMAALRGLAFLCVAIVLALTNSFAQEIGHVDNTAAVAYLLRDGATSEAKQGDILRLNDIVRTNDAGRIRLSLKDGSYLIAGPRSELRVARYDTDAQITLVELLRGKLRAHATTVTKDGGGFYIQTPTAVVVALGTTVQVETTIPVSVITSNEIEKLPTSRSVLDIISTIPKVPEGSISSLSGIPPNAKGGSHPWLGDYEPVDGTYVMSLEHFAGTVNLDSAVKGSMYALPGEYTYIARGQPPTLSQPVYTGHRQSPHVRGLEQKYHQSFHEPVDTGFIPCSVTGLVIDGVIVSSSNESEIGKLIDDIVGWGGYDATGLGTSTGNAIQLDVWNNSACPFDFMVTNGSVLSPHSLSGAITGLLKGNPVANDFQMMMTMGTALTVLPRYVPPPPPPQAPPPPPPPPAAFFTVPENGRVSIPLRSYCLELHKLAPHAKTKYHFAKAADQQALGPNRSIISRVFRMVQNGSVKLPRGQPMDGLIQWSLWTTREGLDGRKFGEEYVRLVKKHFEVEKKKFDKQAEQETNKQAQELFAAVSTVLAAKE
jgi:hypothetical protein